MNIKQRILVAVEPDNHPQDVIDRAVWIAGLNDSELTILWCDPDVGPLGEPFFVSNTARDIGEQIVAAQEQLVEECAAPVRKLGIPYTTRVLEERPVAEGILRYVSDLNPAFLVKGTRYHAVAERSIFVDSDWQLMRRCPCPLWLVKPGTMPDHPVIVAAADPFHSHDKPAALDQVIVDFAKTITEQADGEAHLLHTYNPLAGIGAAVSRTIKPIKVSLDEIDKNLRAEHMQKLCALAESNGIEPENTHQIPGAAHEVIPSFVRSLDADLIVMGTLARWGLKRAFIGSTAERVLDRLPCDTLIVRADNGNS